MKKQSFTRESFYDLIWSIPIKEIQNKFTVSNYGIKELCKLLEIPIPDDEYWDKKKNGDKVQAIKLPERKGEYEPIYLFVAREDFYYSSKDQYLLDFKAKDIRARKDLDFNVPKKLKNPHPLIERAQINLKGKGTNYYKKGVFTTSIEHLTISTSPKMLTRSLCLMDTMLKLFETLGFRISVQHTKTYLYVHKIEFEISLRETTYITKRVESWLHNQEYSPTGKLCFKVCRYPSKEWIDGKDTKLEDKIPQILAYLEHTALGKINWKKESDRSQRIKEEEERKIREFQELQNLELNKFKALLTQANHVHQVSILKKYLIRYENFLKGTKKLNEVKKEWLTWAYEKADWFDPFIGKPDELLDSFDKTSLLKSIFEIEENMDNYIEDENYL